MRASTFQDYPFIGSEIKPKLEETSCCSEDSPCHSDVEPGCVPMGCQPGAPLWDIHVRGLKCDKTQSSVGASQVSAAARIDVGVFSGCTVIALAALGVLIALWLLSGIQK